MLSAISSLSIGRRPPPPRPLTYYEDRVLRMFRLLRYDTKSIAVQLIISEAEAYNVLAAVRELLVAARYPNSFASYFEAMMGEAL